MTLKASDLGEFGLIERLIARLGTPGEGVVVGPGDDAAAVRLGGGATALVTADLLLEGVHFEIGLSSPSDVGWKALAVNLSDIAAMGGVPRFALVSLGSPPATPAATLEQLYAGLDECARSFGVSVVGGDTAKADRLIVSVAVVGEPGNGPIVQRTGALPGDVLCVTGALGGAAAGLALLRSASHDERAAALVERFPLLAKAHRRPVPRIREGIAAARSGASAMIDISDGLARDIGHICEASGCGAVLSGEKIPLAEGIDDVAGWAGVDSLAFAAGGGDDYELAMAVPPAALEELRRAIGPASLAIIGEVTEGSDVTLERDGVRMELDSLGWDHFGGDT
jgi:thiamine-monophosphate kinase